MHVVVARLRGGGFAVLYGLLEGALLRDRLANVDVCSLNVGVVVVVGCLSHCVLFYI